MAIKIKRPIKFVYGFGNKVGFIVPPTPAVSGTPSPTPSPSLTTTPTPTPSFSPSPTPSFSPSPTPSNSPTPTPSATPSTLVLHLDPSDSSSYSGSGNTVNNLVPNGITGTLTSVSFTTPYFAFAGSPSQIAISDNSLLEPGAGDWTMEVWINASNLSSSAVVIGKFSPGGTGNDVSYSMRTTPASKIYGQYGSGSNYADSPLATINLTTWYHASLVFTNIAENTIKLYINGNLQGTTSHSLGSLLNTSTGLYIGSYNNNEYSQNFNGKIGIVRVYNQARTAEQILANYNLDVGKYI
jgi:hypothetical protein